MSMSYREFLEAKKPRARIYGAPIDASAVHPIAKAHQRAIVQWGVQGGRRAIFAAFGLGKGMMQQEIMRLILERVGGSGLIVAPLGVRQDFLNDAAMLNIDLQFVRTTGEMDRPGLYLTNYESVREGKIDTRGLSAVSCDEASIFRGMGGTKTFREFMRLFDSTPYRFVATATPSPNDYIELLSYAAFLGIMDVGEAKTRFFKRNSEKADELTIHPHKVEEFWLWVNSWAVFLQRPSDLGFSDDGYDLPELTTHWHVIDSGARDAGVERDGQGKLLRTDALGVQGAAAEKRTSLQARVQKVVEIAKLERVFPRVLSQEQGEAAGEQPRQLSQEQGEDQGAQQSLAGSEPGALQGGDEAPRGEESREDATSQRGVVCEQQRAGSRDEPAHEARAIRAESEPVRCDGGGPAGSLPDLPFEAPTAAHRPLPQDEHGSRASLQQMQHRPRPLQGQSGSPSRGGELPEQIVIWCDLNDEQRCLERGLLAEGISVTSLSGNQDIETRERLLEDWRERRTTVLLTKPSMYGAGINLQQAHTMIFAGVGFRFQEFIQGIHRIHRFLQVNPCAVHVVYSAGETEVVRTLQAKWKRHDEMMARMQLLIREYGLNPFAAQEKLARSIGVDRQEIRGRGYVAINADTVEETAAMPSDSVGLVITSIPFGTQYEYTPSYNDFGHTDDDAHFFAQMDYLSPELFRVVQPGRMCCVHVKDRVRPGGLDGLGFQTVSPFHAHVILHYQRHGFVYMGMITVVTDVVRENAQTYRLGWSMQCDDGSRMSVGMPEYVLLFRKPPSDNSDGYADVPVEKSKVEYSRGRWQTDAHAFWRSSGNRLLAGEDLIGLEADQIFKQFRGWTFATVYDYERAVSIANILDEAKRLPPSFQLLQPASWHPDVWTDVARMRTLNGLQEAKGRELHLCPLQFDIVDRLIQRFSNPGDVVYDPFAGLFTVPRQALLLGRQGLGVELNAKYFADGVRYLRAAEDSLETPTLFDLVDAHPVEATA